MLKRCSCPNCLGTDMWRVAKGVYKCNYCDSFAISEDVKDPATEEAVRRVEEEIRKETEEKMRKLEEKEAKKENGNSVLRAVKRMMLSTILVFFASGLLITSSALCIEELESGIREAANVISLLIGGGGLVFGAIVLTMSFDDAKDDFKEMCHQFHEAKVRKEN